MEKKIVFQSVITCRCNGVLLTYKSNELVITVTDKVVVPTITPYSRIASIRQPNHFPQIPCVNHQSLANCGVCKKLLTGGKMPVCNLNLWFCRRCCCKMQNHTFMKK